VNEFARFILPFISLVLFLTTVALIARRYAGNDSDINDSYEKKNSIGFWVRFCFIASLSILAANWLLPWDNVTVEPPSGEVNANISRIGAALQDCYWGTGSATTKVTELPQLFEKYLERDHSLSEMIDSGKDIWGHPLVILPVEGKSGQFTLRSVVRMGSSTPVTI
jgi:hypothetical protein